MIGTTLGHYKILDRLGTGGMGVVWLAEDLELGRRVAIKMLRADVAASPEKRARFEREARSVAALNHPNIVTLFAVEEADGQRFLAMEYVEGRTLDDRLEQGPLPPSELLRVGIGVAAALEAAHRHGIVHRDLKPSNVLLGPDGRIKVVDFGLARSFDSESFPAAARPRETSLTQEGLAVGTLHYMSPEQLQNRKVDHRTDLFALGILLYEMATGKMPFPGESAAQVITSVLRDPPRRIEGTGAKLPPQILDLIESLLAKEPDDRPATASEVRTALEAAHLLFQSETAALPATRARKVPGLLGGGGQPWWRPRSALALAGAIAAAAGVAAFLATRVAAPPVPNATPAVPALAVLPLANYAGEPEYFVDGSTDALIGALARVGGLRVISRQSVMRYRGSAEPLPAIARELGAELIVEGSVIRAAASIRLELKLLRADPERTIWSESFERPATAVLALHATAAAAVARAAGVELRADSGEALPMREIQPEHYDLLLRARYAGNQLTPESLERSVELYRELLAADPGFGPAWAGLAIDYGLQGFFNVPPLEAAARAEAAAAKALALDESLAEAHAALGFVLHFYEWDWVKAEAAYRRALELNPSDASSHHRLWGLLALLGRWDEAERELATAVELDPLSVSIATNIGQHRGLRGDLEGAIRALEGALRLQPGYGVAHGHLWTVYHELGREPERGRSLVRMLRHLGFETSARAAESALVAEGYPAAVERAAEALATESTTSGTVAYIVAELYAAAGRQDEALAWLRRSFLDRGPETSWIAVARVFVPLRGRSEYQELLRALRLEPQDGRARRVGG